jgi:probable HAF family extracellular repeat protein
MQDLGTLGGRFSQAGGINDQGQVIGSADTADGSTHAFLWTASDGMQDLGTLTGGTFSEAFGINDQGQVIGVRDMADGSSRAFLWTP